MRVLSLLTVALLLGCSVRQAPTGPPPEPLELQREFATRAGPDQALQQVRLASMALAEGRPELAEQALRAAVARMQDFRADGTFRAMVGAESSKEWKGEPYEKMMAFLYLGLLLFEKGDHGNALAMARSAVLADTGTSAEGYRSDFAAAFVLQALAYDRLGERHNAERAIGRAADALWQRAMVDHLSAVLHAVPPSEDPSEEAARALLLAGLPVGVGAHPREPRQAVLGALSWAQDLRRLALEERPARWPSGLTGLRRPQIRGAHDHFEGLTRAWLAGLEQLPADLLDQLAAEEAFLLSLIDDPGVVLWVETGSGPEKFADGSYGQLLRIRPRQPGEPPSVALDGHPLQPHFLDGITFQAQTRGSRRVDAFLQGKAVFKETAGWIGAGLVTAGDIALRESTELANALYLAGGASWLLGALANPTADTRQWDLLPDALWLVRADPPPGEYILELEGREFLLQVPDEGPVFALIPALPPGGPDVLGKPCVCCAPDSTQSRPLAVPEAGVPR